MKCGCRFGYELRFLPFGAGKKSSGWGTLCVNFTGSMPSPAARHQLGLAIPESLGLKAVSPEFDVFVRF